DGPDRVACSGVFRVLHLSSGLLDGRHHLPRVCDRHRLILLTVKDPERRAFVLCGFRFVTAQYKGTALWIFHGEKDESVPVANSRQMVAAIKKAGGQVKYTEYPGAGHSIWTI